jgi:hypothetical protein
VLRIVPLPRVVDDACDLAIAAQQHPVARSVTVLASVQLDEVARGLAPLADVDGDRQHRVGDRKDRRRSPR